jgi:hypothetical protein
MAFEVELTGADSMKAVGWGPIRLKAAQKKLEDA